MTVSRVINGETGVVARKRDLVQNAISELGYVPNSAARTLAGSGLCRLVLLHDNPSAGFMSALLMGSLEGAHQVDAQLQVEPMDPTEPINVLCARLKWSQANGLLLTAPICDDASVVAGLVESGFAVSRIASTQKLPDSHDVFIDDEAASYAMTKHLLTLGHRRIGFIQGPANQAVSALRAAGYARAMDEAGIQSDQALIVIGDFTYRSGMTAADALLGLEQPPTAIFACNDDMAAAAIAAAHRRRLDVPQDVSVCGFDDTAIATTIWPEITTIRQPVAEMARLATIALAEAVRARNSRLPQIEAHQHLAFQLIRRASDAPPSSSSA
ncbi:MAG: LacI family DNA-binding transcriptional regulator [Alphaproteobacteria bacterium]|nr:LacI family DNA-binding transcriptional regulator [Alphaproteobacteria bacterium]